MRVSTSFATISGALCLTFTFIPTSAQTIDVPTPEEILVQPVLLPSIVDQRASINSALYTNALSAAAICAGGPYTTGAKCVPDYCHVTDSGANPSQGAWPYCQMPAQWPDGSATYDFKTSAVRTARYCPSDDDWCEPTNGVIHHYMNSNGGGDPVGNSHATEYWVVFKDGDRCSDFFNKWCSESLVYSDDPADYAVVAGSLSASTVPGTPSAWKITNPDGGFGASIDY